jgi:hypothetical protein
MKQEVGAPKSPGGGWGAKPDEAPKVDSSW